MPKPYPFFQLQPRLDWIQVEVSSYCHAACSYCPSTIFRRIWQQRHLTLELYRRMLPAFRKTRLVHLQGWGEPLLNPDLLEMIRLAKAKGCRVGTTTSGMAADGDKLAQLVAAAPDFLAFSLAGTDAENDRIRIGTRLEQMLHHIERIQSLKAESNATRPEVHIAYLLLRSNARDVLRLPAMLEGLGIAQVVISTLDFIPGPELLSEVFSPDTSDLRQLNKLLKGVVADGERRGIPVHFQIPARAPQPTCAENVAKSLFISSDGSVSPCVFTNLPLKKHDVSAVKSREKNYVPMIFGNLQTETLAQIWRKKSYKRFRRSFAGNNFWEACLNCPKRQIWTEESALESLRAHMDLLYRFTR